ncbi:SNF-related serine/threonine-protein kinase isoform X2 [Stegostoma tigrinum]|uniref:SNF-related serine/threonine-protein kinase isoform X2 n=1 Tax=Stegostoma tigrinum TaxID=3053191 RepID=UPI00202AF114|nr:SNF-related serine/threonine-protein kinase isoform X2 [Stegostoma tigrinum]
MRNWRLRRFLERSLLFAVFGCAAVENSAGGRDLLQRIDIWSLGVILFMLVCGQPPFQEANDSETLTMIMDCKYTVPSHISKECKDLINRMLQRDPKRRASLEEIEDHRWLRGIDPSPATKCNIPLVSYKNLSEEEHNGIIQRMVLGEIADRETIVEALESNKYNHITATYFLLAERILKEKQEKEVRNRSPSPSHIKAQFRQSWPTKIDVPKDIEDITASPIIHPVSIPVVCSPARTAESIINGHRMKSNEPVKKEEPSVVGSAGKTGASNRTCLFRVEEDEEEDDDDKKAAPLPTQVVLRRKPSITNRLTTRKSAPVLNQIFEEGESDDDFDMDENLPPKLSRLKMNIASPSTVHKRYHKRKNQGRGSSCSSSETSDDDSESRRLLDKDGGFTYSWHRRDSGEGPPGSGGDGSGQGKPSDGNAGLDKSSSSDGNKGGSSPPNNSSGSTNNTGTTTRSCTSQGYTSQSKAAEDLMESLKLMTLCLGSQWHCGNGSRYIVEPTSTILIHEKSTWKMCITSSNIMERVSPSSRNFYSNQMADLLNELEMSKENNMNLKNNVLQLPLCEKTISVNIQRNPKDGLLCSSSQTSCCQVI